MEMIKHFIALMYMLLVIEFLAASATEGLIVEIFQKGQGDLATSDQQISVH